MKKRTKSGCRPLRGRPRHHHWISKCLQASFLHLVTCWHQNLTHALRKMSSGVRCDAQARLSKRAFDSDTRDGSAEHTSSCASGLATEKHTNHQSKKKSRPDTAQSNVQPWTQNQCCGGCCPTRSSSRDQCTQCTFRDSGIPSTATRSEITATFCGRCVTTRHACQCFSVRVRSLWPVFRGQETPTSVSLCVQQRRASRHRPAVVFNPQC